MQLRLLCLVVPLLLTACVTFEVKPDHVVSETVEAGKGLYRKVTNDMVDRNYSYVVASESEQHDAQASEDCFAKLKSIANGASATEAVLDKQQSEIRVIEGQRSVRCSVVAWIKPRN